MGGLEGVAQKDIKVKIYPLFLVLDTRHISTLLFITLIFS